MGLSFTYSAADFNRQVCYCFYVNVPRLSQTSGEAVLFMNFEIKNNKLLCMLEISSLQVLTVQLIAMTAGNAYCRFSLVCLQLLMKMCLSFLCFTHILLKFCL